jgi:membrane fusion protein (multidrug efflux system)
MTRVPRSRFTRLSDRFWPLALVLALPACGGTRDKPKAQPPVVGVVTAQTATVPIDIELPGRTAPLLTSDVRPQVDGILLKRLFTEGAYVREGQPLYQIDPRVYRASVGQAQGNLASAQANAVSAELKARRYSDLETIHAVARQDADDARAAAGQARAAIQQTGAALQSARINLGFTTIRAPSTGRIGRSLVTAGGLVTANQTTALATIQALDPIFVDIQQSSSQLLRLRQALASGGAIPAEAPVRLTLEDGTDYPQTGRLEFNEVTVDPSTGSVTLRARFPNRQGLLLPGMFVRAKVTQTERKGVILLPGQAIQHNPRGDPSVLVVGAGNTITSRPIGTQGMLGDRWIVTSGLRPGDKVVIQGIGNAPPGTVVRPVVATGKPEESAIVTPASKQAMEQASRGGGDGGSGKGGKSGGGNPR